MDVIDRVAAALEYLETHLDQDVTLEEIANHAHTSLFWFHRVFSTLVGMSLGEYLRKRRLSCAGEDLVNTDERIIDIAVKYGFSSHAAFTRSFIRYYGITPAQYRKSGLTAPRRIPVTAEILRRERKLTGGIMSTETITNRSIRIIDLPSCRMAISRGHDLDEFDQWWSALDQQRTDKFYPRDFMFYNAQARELVWLYAFGETAREPLPFDVIDFSGGLYAAAISRDGDDLDGERAVAEIKDWVRTTGYFELDDSRGHGELFHITTSDRAFQKMHYRQLEIYVPVK